MYSMRCSEKGRSIPRGATSRPLQGSEQIAIDAVSLPVFGDLGFRPHKCAYAWLVAVLDHELAPRPKGLQDRVV
jgi:hypothetical protein